MALQYPGASPALSGKLGPNVFARNAGGAYVRARVRPVNPSSVAQQGVRATFGALSTTWTVTLDALERDSWTDWASKVSRINRIGLPIFLKGNAAFIGANSLRVQAGLDVVTDGPTVFALATITPPAQVGSPTSGELTAGFTFTATDEWNEADGALLAFFSRPQNGAINFFKGPYELANVFAPGTVSLTAGTVTFPMPAGPAGSKIFYRFVGTSSDGRPTQDVFGVIVIG